METSILEDAAALAAMAVPAKPVVNASDYLDILRDIMMDQYKAGKLDSFAFVAADKSINGLRAALLEGRQ